MENPGPIEQERIFERRLHNACAGGHLQEGAGK